MNILFITNHLNIGGITSYVLTLAGGLKKRGHNVYLASGGGRLLPRFIQEGIIYIPIPIKTKSEISLKMLLSYFKLKGFLRKNQIDILHVNSRTTQVLGNWLSRKTGISCILTCHGFFKRRFSRRIFPCWGRKIIAISGQVKEHLIKDFKVDEKNIIVIYNGIDINRPQASDIRCQAEIKKQLDLKDGHVIGIVARLSDVKGHIYLIRAMKTVLNIFSQAQLLIVGSGRLKKGLVNLVRDLGIEKNVRFLPEVSDTKEVLLVMDIFVMPSLEEGLGLALMEAMAQEKACIGSDVGGIRSLIQGGYNGLLVKPADSESLAGAITELLNSSQKREYLAGNAREFIEKNFSQEKMVSDTEMVYLSEVHKCLNARG
ncbi:MAG: glycosyltransferase family 4 protein [Candidatus Omnitrophota bacterium]|nr:glycosyltransferase family 4 protein [Candidatus Omnitrophota bacterium]